MCLQAGSSGNAVVAEAKLGHLRKGPFLLVFLTVFGTEMLQFYFV